MSLISEALQKDARYEDGEFELIVWKDHWEDCVYIAYGFRSGKNNYKLEVINLYTKETCVVEEGKEIPKDFAMCLSMVESDIFLPLFMEMLIDQQVEPKDSHYVKGELEATKRHLEDMRLAFGALIKEEIKKR